MNVSERDKKIIMVIVPLVVVLGYWFMLLAPKREAAATAETTLIAEQGRLADAESQAATVQAAKANFARDYAAVVALGKAIPTSVDMPSLLVQLEQAAHGTGIELEGITVGERAAAESGAATTATPAAPDPAAAAPSGDAPASAPGQAVASAQGAADAATPAATPPGGAPASTGALESVSLEFDFKGSFFELADYFHRLKRFVYVDGDKVRVRGRLLTIDHVEYSADPASFPALTAKVTASVFLTPKTEGATAGATPAGPTAAASAAPVPASSASTGSGAPTPTAASTP